MIPRHCPLQRIADAFRIYPVAALLGPRQCGKTTLARRSLAGRDAPAARVAKARPTGYLSSTRLCGQLPLYTST
jgi:hypothetical protein